MLRVSYQELFDTLLRVLLKQGFAPERARRCAQLVADSNRDGVYSHGLNRFSRFLSMIHGGLIDLHAEPILISSAGALETLGRKQRSREPECLSVHGKSDRAVAGTRRWLCGAGEYQSLDAWWDVRMAGSGRVIGICWTNTLPNLPPWGASDPRVGNNPLVIAVPRPEGHVVLDMAMSQFSYGALAAYRMRGELLPVDGGFDATGRLTRVPEAIEASNRPLPIGFWKGSGLALMLDLLATLLSGGKATHQITADPDRETTLSQVFTALNPAQFDQSQGRGLASQAADQIIEYFQGSPHSDSALLRYPGQRVLDTRKENLENGVPVDPSIWQQLQAL